MAFFRMFPDGGAAERALQSAELKRFVKQGLFPVFRTVGVRRRRECRNCTNEKQLPPEAAHCNYNLTY